MSDAGRSEPAQLAFGTWRFDASTGDLSDGSATIRLEPQVAKLLRYFLARQGTLISRDDLIADVWEGRVVSDHAVNRCISILRNQLSPEDRNAYIETVVRRGFISHFPPPDGETVSAGGNAPGGDAAPGRDMALAETKAPIEPPPGRRTYWLLGWLAGAAALVVFGVLRLLGDPPALDRGAPAPAPMVAVLPFISAGLEADSDFFARGLHDDLLTRLAQLESIRVISRTSVSGYRDREHNIREIGRELGADAILEGGVQRVGDHIRINVQLIDAHTDIHLWAEQYDRELTPANIFGIQAEIARAVASALNSTLTQQDATQLDTLPTDNMAAYRAYHEAMQLRASQTIGTPAYIAALERAVALDPGFLRAWAELAGSLSLVDFGRVDPDSIQRLEKILERIRALAPQSAEHLIAQSYYTYYVLKDYDRAYELVSQALSLRPSDPQVLELQSWIQRRQGDFAGNIETIRRARALDPKSPYWTNRLATNLAFAHRYDEAIAVLENATVDSFGLSALRSSLRVRDHGEPGRLLEDLVNLQREYGVAAEPLSLWEAHIAARDYEGAEVLLESVQAAELPYEDWALESIPNMDLARVITHRLRDATEPMDALLVELRGRLDEESVRETWDLGDGAHLAMALLSAAEGNRTETERLVRTWFRKSARDPAELTMQRHYACRALGMAGAAPAAIECLREAIVQASRAMPFLEPLLPYYDPLRDDPRFVALVAELRDG